MRNVLPLTLLLCYHFSLSAFKSFCMYLIFWSLIIMCFYGFLTDYPSGVWSIVCTCRLVCFAIFPLNTFYCTHIFSSLPKHQWHIISLTMASLVSDTLFYFIFSLSFSCCSNRVIFVYYLHVHWFLFSLCSIPLLHSSTEFLSQLFVCINYKISPWFLCISSISLLRLSIFFTVFKHVVFYSLRYFYYYFK